MSGQCTDEGSEILEREESGPKAEMALFITDSLTCWAQEGLMFSQPYSTADYHIASAP